MRNRLMASLAILIPVIIQGIIELSKIVVALISAPDNKRDPNNPPPST